MIDAQCEGVERMSDKHKGVKQNLMQWEWDNERKVQKTTFGVVLEIIPRLYMYEIT